MTTFCKDRHSISITLNILLASMGRRYQITWWGTPKRTRSSTAGNPSAKCDGLVTEKMKLHITLPWASSV